ncbi:MAG: hypothetical protein D6772_14175 [Bacteroidetes bacterium]|nr:MAG: hypothetical protein D6772_14175 [Bacteroidota bacterium]
MNVQVSAVALFNIFNAAVTGQVEGNDTIGPFVFPGDNPTNYMISQDQDLTITVDWTAAGVIPSLAPLDYTLTLYLDNNPIATKTHNAAAIAPPMASVNYSEKVVLPSGQAVGVHDLSITLTVRQHNSPNMHLPVAGHQRLGTLFIFAN